MKRLFRLISSVPLLMMIAIATSCSQGGGSVVEGVAAPDFTATCLNGGTVSLADQRGKVVLLHFWATWCHYCIEEAPSLARLEASMAGRNFRMITVAADKGGAPVVEKFLRGAGLSFPTVSDPSGTLGRRYGITGVPETFIIDGQGVVRKKIIGARVWDDPELVAYLDNLMTR